MIESVQKKEPEISVVRRDGLDRRSHHMRGQGVISRQSGNLSISCTARWNPIRSA